MKHFWKRLYGLFRLRIQLWQEDIFKQTKPKTQPIEQKPTVTLYTRTKDRKDWTKKKLKQV